MSKKNKEYLEASKKLNQEQIDNAYDRAIIEQIEDDDQKAAEYVDKMKEGFPLVLNFEKLDFINANKMLAFFSGACYASEGKIVKINEATYLFARKVDFLDGSLKEFIESI